jgi:hypothetical protein
MASLFGNDVAGSSFVSRVHIVVVDDDLDSSQRVSSHSQIFFSQETGWRATVIVNQMVNALHIWCPIVSYTYCGNVVV